MDSHLNAKIADLELSSTELTGREREADMSLLVGLKQLSRDMSNTNLVESISKHQLSPLNEQLPVWLAPEVIQDAENYTQASDIYALGLVLWEIMSTKIPYQEECGDNYSEIREFVLSGERPKFVMPFTRTNTYDDPSIINMNTYSTTYCNANGYNVLHNSYMELTKQCWSSHPSARPKISDIVRILETDCWSHTVHSYIYDTEYVIDPMIVTAEYRSKCKVPERKQFFSSVLSSNIIPNSNSNNTVPSINQYNISASPATNNSIGGISMNANGNIEDGSGASAAILNILTQTSANTANANPSVNVQPLPPSASFISSLMNTLKCDNNWLKLEACVAADADITKWIGTSTSNHGGGYCVLSATATSPYLIVWCTKYWLYHSSMPISHSGTTLNDILALELGNVLYDYAMKHIAKPSRRELLKKSLTKLDILNDKALLNRNIENTIATGRANHCVIQVLKPVTKANTTLSSLQIPLLHGLNHAEEFSIVRYSLHIIPVFTKPIITASANLHEDNINTPPVGSIPIPASINRDSRSNSSVNRDRSGSAAALFSAAKQMVSSSVASVFQSSSVTNANTSANAAITSNTPSHGRVPTPTLNTPKNKRSVAYVVIHFSNLCLPPLSATNL